MLYGQLTRTMLLTAANQPFAVYTPLWSTAILDELSRNLRKRARMPAAGVVALLERIHGTYPRAVVDPDPEIVRRMPNHPKDRHVLAVAVQAQADQVVTWNIRDFRGAEWLGLRAVTPDAFLARLWDEQPATMTAVVALRASLGSAPVTVAELLTRCESIGLREFAARVRGGAAG